MLLPQRLGLPAYHILHLTSSILHQPSIVHPRMCVQLIQLRLSLSQLGVSCSGQKVVRLFPVSAVAAEKWYDFLKSGTTFSRISCSRRWQQLTHFREWLSRRQLSCFCWREEPLRAHARPSVACRSRFSKKTFHFHTPPQTGRLRPFLPRIAFTLLSHMRGLSDCESDVKRLRRPSRGATPANRLYTGTFSTHCESESIFLKNTFSALFFAVPKINGIFAPSNQKQDGPNIQYG